MDIKSKARPVARAAGREANRLIVLVALIGLLFWAARWLPEASGIPELAPVLSTTAVVLSLLIASHVSRRVLFPRLDMQAIAQRACADPIGAAIVFGGVCLVLATLISSNVGMLR